VTTTVEVTTRCKLHPKGQALALLGQHLGLFEPHLAADTAFIEDFIPVVLKHITDPAARDEVRKVIEAHRSNACLRNVTPLK